METPLSSMRRVTRSQSAAILQKSKKQEEAKRLPLLDISNDSPIIGLTTDKTPNHNSSKKDCTDEKRAPQSGQSILRCQVKTLLQSFEAEKDTVTSEEVVPTPCEEENQLNRELLFDSPEKSESSYSDGSIDSSSLTSETRNPISSPEDERSSVWSIEVNASSEKEQIEEIEAAEFYEESYYESEEEEVGGDFFDDLCEGINKMRIIDDGTEKGKRANLPEFTGTRTKFVYNSEDEIEDQLILLRGLPAPEGTHLRFCNEEN